MIRHRPRSFLVLLLAAALGCAPAGEPQLGLSDAELPAVFEALHRPIYEVYDLPIDRDAVWDLLAASFSGPALTREYIEHFTTLVRMEEDETAIAVLEVDYESIEVLDRQAAAIRVEVDWSVGGVVTHRGHHHPRVNRYRAVYTLGTPTVEVPERVRIVDTRMKDLSRVRSTLDGQPGWSLDNSSRSGAGRMDPSSLLRAGMISEVQDEDPMPDTLEEGQP